MSALPPKADIRRHDWNVRFVPKADICSAANSSLFDHLVGAGEQQWWHGESKRLCGRQIKDEIELSWLLDRQILGLRPPAESYRHSHRRVEIARESLAHKL